MAFPTPRRISELDVAGPLTGAEQLVFDQNNRTVKGTIATVKDFTDTSCQCTLVSRYNSVSTTGIAVDYLYTYTMPGNTLATDGSWLEIFSHGNFANNANNKSISFEIESNVVGGFGGDTFNQNTEWLLKAIVTRTSSTQFIAYVEIITNATGGVVGQPYSSAYSTAGVVSSFSNDIVILMTGSADPLDLTANAFIIRHNKLDADS